LEARAATSTGLSAARIARASFALKRYQSALLAQGNAETEAERLKLAIAQLRSATPSTRRNRALTLLYQALAHKQNQIRRLARLDRLRGRARRFHRLLGRTRRRRSLRGVRHPRRRYGKRRTRRSTLSMARLREIGRPPRQWALRAIKSRRLMWRSLRRVGEAIRASDRKVEGAKRDGSDPPLIGQLTTHHTRLERNQRRIEKQIRALAVEARRRLNLEKLHIARSRKSLTDARDTKGTPELIGELAETLAEAKITEGLLHDLTRLPRIITEKDIRRLQKEVAKAQVELAAAKAEGNNGFDKNPDRIRQIQQRIQRLQVKVIYLQNMLNPTPVTKSRVVRKLASVKRAMRAVARKLSKAQSKGSTKAVQKLQTRLQKLKQKKSTLVKQKVALRKAAKAAPKRRGGKRHSKKL